MHRILFSFLMVGMLEASAQDGALLMKPDLYNPAADAQKQIDDAVAKAKKENKHVFLQIGGNWCKWCLRFNKFTTGDAQVDSAFSAGYMVEHINFSKENKNLPVMEKLSFPQRFGFPVFVILDGNGNRLHTQSSWYLEDGKESYDKEKTLDFLSMWTTTALIPEQYK